MSSGRSKLHALGELARRCGGEVAGDPSIRVRQVATLENASAGDIAFLANERYVAQLGTTRATAVILGTALAGATTLPRIVSDNPYACFARVSAFLNPPPAARAGIHRTAVVHRTARLGRGVEVGPHAVVGPGVRVGAGTLIGASCHVGEDTVIGASSRIYPGVVIYHRCVIGDRVVVHSGVVIGADGFGIAMDRMRWVKVPQIGRVQIGDDVEIGANTTVDRGTIDDTVIEEGVKLDNQIQVAHNVRIGAHTAVAACAGIAGSARIGRHCRIGGSAGIAGHITLADNVEISAHTIIMKSISEPGTYSGAYPAQPNAEWRRNAAQLRHLHALAQRVRALEKLLDSERSKP